MRWPPRAHQLVGVLTQPDRPAGTRPRAARRARSSCGALVLGLPDRAAGAALRAMAELATLRDWQPDVLVVVAYGLMLPQAVLELPRLGCLNIHASLLPRWRGAAPIQRAILAGDATTGVTIMQMDAGLDTGPIFAQRRCAIEPRTTVAGELHDQLATLGARAAARGARRAGQAAPRRRTPSRPSGVTYASKLSKDEALIDWSAQRPAHVDRQVRAFNPWPVARNRPAWRAGEAAAQPRCAGSRAAPVAIPGTVTGLVDDALVVACGQGVLQVLQLQRAGRRAGGGARFPHARRARRIRAPLHSNERGAPDKGRHTGRRHQDRPAWHWRRARCRSVLDEAVRRTRRWRAPNSARGAERAACARSLSARCAGTCGWRRRWMPLLASPRRRPTLRWCARCWSRAVHQIEYSRAARRQHGGQHRGGCGAGARPSGAAAGFVNAVLRRYLREREALLPAVDRDRAGAHGAPALAA